MKLMFNSSDTNFLELYKPEIVFEDNVFLAEDEASVNMWLDDYGLTKDDLINAGLKIMKNKITLPKGTKCTVLATSKHETSLRVKDIEFDCHLSYDADYAYVEAEALDKERETVFSKYNGSTLPKDDDKTEFYGFYLIDIVHAMNDLRMDGNNKRNAFEAVKMLTKDEVYQLMLRYFYRKANEFNNMSTINIALDENTFDKDSFNIFRDKSIMKELKKNTKR